MEEGIDGSDNAVARGIMGMVSINTSIGIRKARPSEYITRAEVNEAIADTWIAKVRNTVTTDGESIYTCPENIARIIKEKPPCTKIKMKLKSIFDINIIDGGRGSRRIP